MGIRMGLHRNSSHVESHMKNIFWTTLLVDALVSWESGLPGAISYDEVGTQNISWLGKLAVLVLKAAKISRSISDGGMSGSTQFCIQTLTELDQLYEAIPASYSFSIPINREGYSQAGNEEPENQLVGKAFVNILYHGLVISIVHSYGYDTWQTKEAESLDDLSQCFKPTPEYLVQERSLSSAGAVTEILVQLKAVDPRYYQYGLEVSVYLAGLVYVGVLSCVNFSSTEFAISNTCIKEHILFLERTSHFKLAQKLSLQKENVLHSKNSWSAARSSFLTSSHPKNPLSNSGLPLSRTTTAPVKQEAIDALMDECFVSPPTLSSSSNASNLLLLGGGTASTSAVPTSANPSSFTIDHPATFSETSSTITGVVAPGNSGTSLHGAGNNGIHISAVPSSSNKNAFNDYQDFSMFVSNNLDDVISSVFSSNN
ncbi:hypothetical protein AX774_g3928 [Zancudomyces culisetae]|uniref:Transcription factor domain-containing protein n=1 Tax=Zancudomyces culisetae TaxID=1213189 RepID=A0A1R1PGQ1_ZANCU|nr:hypothetical protein AX774_g6444 [Zancudomyces culisetae]OMH82576.1 hypothetical protein AX774_g3928 [Zancudomyces culisetae]|eukprot:OMH80117.1 hypothetical protein AX774_g6444 [Zancudomyces culisetae]